MLVSNIGQTAGADNTWNINLARYQGFTTGSNSAGYTLESIEVKVHVASTLSAQQIATVTAQLWSATSTGLPDEKLADLTVPSSIASGNVTFAAPANTTLAASTTYFVRIKGQGVTNLRAVRTSSDAEDSGAAAGWSIENLGRHCVTALTRWDTAPLAYNIRVNGSAASAAPDAPTGLTVTPGNAQLSVSWTAPSGTVTGYDVHYTSNTTVAAGATVQAGAASVGWKAVSRSGTTASQTISTLTNGVTYRVRVRAKNTNGDSAWVQSSGTPSASAATAIWSATLTVKSTTGFLGCYNTGREECSSTSVLTDDDFTVSSTDWAITGILADSTSLAVAFDQDVRTALDSYNFCVGETALAFSSATHNANESATWTTTATSGWSAGDMVALSINTSCAQQAVQAPPTDLAVTPGDAQLTVSWTAPSNVDDISGYELDFTSSTSVADDAASSGTDPHPRLGKHRHGQHPTAPHVVHDRQRRRDPDQRRDLPGAAAGDVPRKRLRVQLGHPQRVRRHGHLVRHADGEGDARRLGRLYQHRDRLRVQFDLGADGRRLHGLEHGLGDTRYLG